jgi:hypothetical protein
VFFSGMIRGLTRGWDKRCSHLGGRVHEVAKLIFKNFVVLNIFKLLRYNKKDSNK